MLAGIQLIPLVYVCIGGYEYYPPKGKMLEDPAVAELLDLDISAGIPLVGYSAVGVGPLSLSFKVYSKIPVFKLY